VKLLYIYIIDV